jgi:phenylacetate-CoA ligase
LSRWIHAKLIYPSVTWAVGEGQLYGRLRELRVLERLEPEALRRYQADRLRDVLCYAHARCRYYRETWPGQPPTSSDAALAFLSGLPTLTKRDVQDRLPELTAVPRVPRPSRKITGGSTGEAVTVLKDRAATARERAAMWLGYGWRGIRIGDPVARFWGAPFATRRRWVTRTADFAMNRIRFSAFAFNQADLERYWHRCLAFGPFWLHGYVSMLESFAAFVVDRGYDGRQLPLRSIVATSEPLTPPQRTLIEQAFGAPVQVEYGCGEVGPIAYSCEAGNLHLMTADLIIEVLRADGTPAGIGETGEIVVTDLNNRAMPLIRYRLADTGALGAPCVCGRAFPVLANILGRAYDFVSTPDGRNYHGEFFMYLFEDLRRAGVGIRAFQVTQEQSDLIDIAVVTKESLEIQQEEAVRTLLRERMPAMRVRLSQVPAIERSVSGKMHLIRNRLGERSARDQASQPTSSP